MFSKLFFGLYAGAMLLAPSLLAGTAAAQTAENYRRYIVDATNQYRAQNGAGQLVVNRTLCQVAWNHANNMARQDKYGDSNTNGHILDGKGPADRIRDAGYNGSWAENVGWNLNVANPPQAMMDAWIKSPGHQKNMVNPIFTEFGVGAAQGRSGKWYFVHVFGRPASANIRVSVRIENRTAHTIDFRIEDKNYSMRPGQSSSFWCENATGRVQYGISWPTITSGGIFVGGGTVGYLTNGQSYAFVNEGTEFRFATIGANGGNGGGVNPVPIIQRLQWASGNGFIRHEGNGQWAEFQNGALTFRFVETGRNNEFIELYDSSRGYHLRLYGDAMQIKGGKQGVGMATFPEFTKLVSGAWTR